MCRIRQWSTPDPVLTVAAHPPSAPMALPFPQLPLGRVVERLSHIASAVVIRGAALFFAVLAQILILPAAAAGLVLRRGERLAGVGLRLAADLAGEGARLALRLAASPLSGLTKPRSARRLALCGRDGELRSPLEVLDVRGMLTAVVHNYILEALSPLLPFIESLPNPAKTLAKHFVMLAVKWLVLDTLKEVLLAAAAELIESVSTCAGVVLVLAGVYFLCSISKDRLLSSSSCD